MINKILFKYNLCFKQANYFNFSLCVLDSNKENILLLENPLLIYNLNQDKSVKPTLVKDILFNSLDQVEQEALTGLSNKVDKKSKINVRVINEQNNSDLKKNKIKSRKKIRSQINLKSDDILLDNKNFISENVQDEDHVSLSLIKAGKSNKSKKKNKFKKDIVNAHVEINHSFNTRNTTENNEINKQIILDVPLTIHQLSDKLNITEEAIITWLFLKGISVTINQVVDISIATEVAKYYGFNILDKLDDNISTSLVKTNQDGIKIEFCKSVQRAPIITIFGHVDHGKTTLLDCIRRTNLVESEIGGITQSIKGYEVEYEYFSSQEKLFFLDTPGHEAFTGMRLRGAQVTDIAVLVVAADDGLKPQSIEAINHILSRNIPYVVAINKIDKENIELEKVKQQLAQYNIVDKNWGGNSEIIEISALKALNIDLLLSSLCNLSKKQNLQANPEACAQGTILEAHLDKKAGPVASLVVQNGTLRIGDIVVAGALYSRVRVILNSCNIKVNQANPSSVVNMWGFSSLPPAGLKFQVVQNEKDAKYLVNKNLQTIAPDNVSNILNKRVTLDSYSNKSRLKIVNIILKADTQGSIEAIISSFSQIPQEKVQINILSANSGSISNKDIELAIASQSIILGFNINVNSNLRNIAEKSGIKISLFNIIYSLLDYIKNYMLSLVDVDYNKILIGKATVQTVFYINKGTVAGCIVNSGKLKKNANISIYRNQDLLYSGLINSLKRIKDDVEEVIEGNECGVMCINYDTWNRLDIIEAYELVEKIKVL